MPIFIEKVYLCPIFDFRDSQKDTFGTPFSSTKATKEHEAEVRLAGWRLGCGDYGAIWAETLVLHSPTGP